MGVRVFLAVLVSLLIAAPAQAATFVVTKKEDSRDGQCNADCSLREAVDAANVDGGADEIVLPPGILRLTLFGVEDDNANGDLDVLTDMTIRGTGAAASTIQSSVDDRVIDLIGSTVDLRLIDLTITGGRALTPNKEGGGIRSMQAGELLLERVVVRGNIVQGEASSASGGGIFKELGPLVVRDSAIVGNQALGGGSGGGIWLDSAAATLALSNVTIAENRASFNGGGVFLNSEIPAEIVNTTITGNEAAGEVGGMLGTTPDVVMRSSILAGNTAVNPNRDDCEEGGQFAELLVSEGGNVGPAGCGFGQASDAPTAVPLLGGLTATAIPVLEPLPGSPALDRAVGFCPATDARGVARPQGPACDAGAAELPVAGSPAQASQPVAGGSSAARINKLPKVLRLQKGKLSVLLSCQAGSRCAGQVKVTRPAPARRGRKAPPTILAQTSFAIAGGKTTVVKAPLTRSGKVAMERRNSLAATLTVVLKGAAGTQTAKVQLTRPLVKRPK